MTDPRITRFRLRLLVAAGVALGSGRFLPLARAGESSGSSGGSSSSDGSSSDGSSSDGSSSDGSSSDPSSADGSSSDTSSSTSSSSTSSSSTSSGDTSSGDTSSTTYDDYGDFDCGGCYGRPYVADHHARVAAPITSNEWHDDIAIAEIGRLDAARREALVAFWTDAALSEHSSVAGFHRFALDLLAHGAPAELVAQAQRAAIQELEHARACFGLASTYAGRSIGPGPIAMGEHAPVASTLVELAVWTVNEGCVGETVAAWLASEILERAEDPTVRAVMAKIAAEEAEHAELAWATLRWAIAKGGAEVATAVAATFRAARVRPRIEDRVHDSAHGLMSSADVAASMHRAFTEIVRPCAARLVAA